MVAEREEWTVTTHDWSLSVDREHLRHIRERRDIYAAGGIRHLILEVLAYANDEAEALGRIGRATVAFEADGRVTIRDNGRGTDTRYDNSGRPVRKPVMATQDVRFFDAADPARLSDGFPRRGMSVVAALSSLLIHENRRVDGAWAQSYRHGVPDDELHVVSSPQDAHRAGTTVTFMPDQIDGPRILAQSDPPAFPWLEIAQPADAHVRPRRG